jgi:Fe-S-cluster containining protein
MLFELVRNMPEPQRNRVSRRFDQALEKLKAAGLLDALEHINEAGVSDEQDLAVSKAYYAQRIDCPFLENECCSIYPVRPSMCREYLMVSPPEYCNDPFENKTRLLPLSMRLSEALTNIWSALLKRPPELVPLMLAMEWTRNNDAIRTLAVKPGALVKALQQQVQSIAKRIEKNGQR